MKILHKIIELRSVLVLKIYSIAYIYMYMNKIFFLEILETRQIPMIVGGLHGFNTAKE